MKTEFDFYRDRTSEPFISDGFSIREVGSETAWQALAVYGRAAPSKLSAQLSSLPFINQYPDVLKRRLFQAIPQTQAFLSSGEYADCFAFCQMDFFREAHPWLNPEIGGHASDDASDGVEVLTKMPDPTPAPDQFEMDLFPDQTCA